MTKLQLQHKRLAGRATLKEYLIPLALMLFWIYITTSSLSFTFLDAVYSLRNLPPLSTSGEWVKF
jgi:hypothetical protein